MNYRAFALMERQCRNGPTLQHRWANVSSRRLQQQTLVYLYGAIAIH